MALADDVWNDMTAGVEDSEQPQSSGSFGGNLLSDVVDTVKTYASTVYNEGAKILTPVTVEQMNDPDFMQQYYDNQNKFIDNIETPIGGLAMVAAIPASLGVSALAPIAAGLGAAYLPKMGSDIRQSIAENGVGSTAYDYTVGQFTNAYNAVKNTTSEELYNKPFSTSANLAMNVLPAVMMTGGLVKMGKHGVSTYKESTDNPLEQAMREQPTEEVAAQNMQPVVAIFDRNNIPTPADVMRDMGAVEETPAEGVKVNISPSSEDANTVVRVAEENGTDPQLVLSIAARETGGDDVNAITMHPANGSPGGIMQITEESARDYGINDMFPNWQTDAEQNIKAGIYILNKKIEENNGDVWAGVRAYNGAGEAADAYLNQVQKNYNSLDGQSNSLPELSQKYYTAVESESPDIADMDTTTENKMNYLAKAYEDKYGEPLQITSGKREGAADASDHNTGHAFDVGNDRLVNDADARAWLIEKGRELGLNPLDEVEHPSAHATGPHVHFSDRGGTVSMRGGSADAQGARGAYEAASEAERAAEQSREQGSDIINNAIDTTDKGWRETSAEYLKRITEDQDKVMKEEADNKAAIPDETKPEFLKTDDEILDDHKQLVQQALAEGKNVPDEVLREYPDLQEGTQNLNTDVYKPLDSGKYGSIDNPDVNPSKPDKVYNVTEPELNKEINSFVQSYTGHVGNSAFKGFYDLGDKYIRVRAYGDYDTHAHEIGHSIDSTLKIRGYDNELINAAEKIWGDNPIFQNYTPAVKRAEGIAEFGRQYLLNPYRASLNFPGYSKAFTDALKKNPDFAKKIDHIGEMMRNWYRQAPEARARGAVSFGNELPKPPIKERLSSMLDRAQTAWITSTHGMDKLSSLVEKEIGRKLTFEEDPAKQARVSNTSPIGRAEMMLGIKVKTPEIMLQALNEVNDGMLKYPVTMKDIFTEISDKKMSKKYPDYLQNAHASDWHQAFSSYLAARRAIELKEVNYESPLKLAQDRLQQAKDDYDAIKKEYDNSLSIGLKKGGLRDQYIQAKVALRNAQADLNHIQRAGYKTHLTIEDAKNTVNNAPKEFESAAEKTYQYNDNLVSIMQSAGLISTKDAEALRGKYKYYVPMGRDFSEAGGVANAFSRSKGFINASAPIDKLKEGGSSRLVKDPIEQMVRNTYAVLEAAEKNRVTQSIVSLSNLREVGKLIVEVPGETASNAKESIFTVMENGEKHAYQTIPEIYEAISNLNMPSFNNAFKFASIFSRMLRLGSTGVNPAFMAANLIKDGFTAAVYDKNMIPIISTLKGIHTILTDEQTVAEFRASGAPMAALVGMDRPNIQSRIQMLASDGKITHLPLKDQPQAILNTVIEAFRNASEAIENGTRIEEFKQSRKLGKSIQEAGLDAKDITTDFSRGGTYGKQANQLIAFFNAAIQGPDRMVRAFKDNPVGTSWNTARWIVLPSLALYALNYSQQWYQDLPNYTKDMNWCISPDGGKTVLLIPKPYELGIFFGSSLERALDQVNNIDPKGMKRWRDDAINVLTPGIIPSIAEPLLGWTANYNWFTGKGIVNERDLQHTAPNQYNAYTSEIAKKIGALTGFSPEKIDYAIQGYTGGAGKLLSETSNYLMGDHTTMPNKGVSDIPGVNRFAKNSSFVQSQAVSDFYDTYTRMQQEYADTGKKQQTTAIHSINVFHQQISELNKRNRTILDNPNLDGDQKAALMEQNNTTINNIAKKANKMFPPQ
jgi:hypothetical protein